MKMHQTDFRKLSLPEFRKWIQYLLDAGWHERLLSAVCFCFKEWRKSSKANSNRIKVNSKLRDEIERLRLSNNRLQKGNPLQAELEQLIAPGIKPKQELTTLAAEIEELKRLNRNGLAIADFRYKEYQKLIAISQKLRAQNDIFYSDLCAYQKLVDEDAELIKRLSVEILRLKQQLAARTVSTDFYPGQFITYYPN